MGDFPDRLTIPPEVEKIARRLEDAGYETWCVGGAIRDNLMGLPNNDVDLATAAPPQRVREILGPRRTIPVGIEHGTVAVLDADRRTHEVTTFRRDIRTDGRRAVVEFGVSLDDDLARRDFTINAIAYHPFTRAWRDPFDGRDDLEAGVIRAVGDPRLRFREDYLRILRALRFAARFGFEVEPATRTAARDAMDGLRRLSAERVRDEWMKGLAGAKQPAAFVMSWHEMGALAIWLQEVEQNIARDPAALSVVDSLPKDDPILVTSALSPDPAATLGRLRCANAQIERGRRIAESRGDLPAAGAPIAVRRWLARVGPVADDLITLAEADGRAMGLRTAVAAERQEGVALSVRDLAVDGNDLMKSGVREGPEVRRVLEHLLDAVLEDPSLNRREALLARIPDAMDATRAEP